MHKTTFTLILYFIAVLCYAQMPEADKILGAWINEDNDSKIEIYKNGSSYAGKLVWGTSLFESDGSTLKKDVNNPEEALRSRTLMNATILSNFVYNDGVWESGSMYDPKSGKTYNCQIKLRDDKLEVRGFVGISLLGKSTYWQKAQ